MALQSVTLTPKLSLKCLIFQTSEESLTFVAFKTDSSIYGGPQLSRQNLFTHGNINFATARSISPRQNQFRHGKLNFATANSIPPRQNHFHSRQYTFHHGKITFIHGKIHFTTAKSFWRACSRDISSQSAMGVNPTWRSSSWFNDST